MSSIGFIGGGRITRIMAGGWMRAGTIPSQLLIHEPDDAAFGQAIAVCPAATRASLDRAAAADVVFIALHPPNIADAVAAMKPAIRKEAVLVSLAPKITIEQLTACSGTHRIARVIPNAPSIMGQGYNPVAFGPALDDHGRNEVLRVLRPLGEVTEAAEADLEAYAILSGMGPTYFWFQWQALRDIAGRFGLSRSDADDALRGMVTGSLALLLDAELPPETVMDLVPVKPFAAHEGAIIQMYQDTLVALHARIAPAHQPAVTR